jgi:hypothetical protein
MLRVNSKEALVLWIMSAIMLTTVFMPFGLPANSGPVIIGTLWLLLSLAFFLRAPFGPMILGYQFFLFILLVSVLLGMVKVLFSVGVDLNLYLYNLVFRGFPKLLFLILIYFLVSQLDHNSVIRVSYRYSIMLIFTIGLALVLYEIFPIHRFVWYHDRFAGLHFELVNFSFTSFTAGIILIYSHFRSKLTIYLAVILLSIGIWVLSKSNYVPIFIASMAFSTVLLRVPRQLRSTIYLSYFAVLISILLILPSLLEYIEKVLFLFPRSSATLGDSNPIYIRLFRHIFAIQYFFDNIFSLPDGFFNGGVFADLNLIDSWSGGSGLSKLFMDFGLLVIPFLSLLIGTFLKILKTMNPKNRKDQMYFILVNLCFAYGYLQAGFFNFTSVTLFLLSLRYWKII